MEAEQTVTPEQIEAMLQRLGTVRSGIAEACRDSGRAPESVTLMAVTKIRPSGGSTLRYIFSMGFLCTVTICPAQGMMLSSMLTLLIRNQRRSPKV